jgi:L-asparagine oxygenase
MRALASRLKAHPTKLISTVWNQNLHTFRSLASTRIDDKTKQKFTEIVEAKSDDPYQNYLEAQQQSESILRNIVPQYIQEILKDVGDKGRSLVLLQNCPIIGAQGLPATPRSFDRSVNKDYVSEYFMLGIAGLIGAEPYLIKNVRDGNVITQIIPLQPDSISGSGSKKFFDLHNEVVHESRVPDFFLLLCLRGNPFAKTTFCLLEDIIKYLPPQIIEELQKPNFLMKSGDKSVFKEAKEFQCPILTKDEFGNFDIRLNVGPDRCEGLTAEAKHALAYVKHCLRDYAPIHDIALAQGDTLIVNNKKSLHGRAAFDENYKENPEDDLRWIQRINLTKDADTKTTNR